MSITCIWRHEGSIHISSLSIQREGAGIWTPKRECVFDFGISSISYNLLRRKTWNRERCFSFCRSSTMTDWRHRMISVLIIAANGNEWVKLSHGESTIPGANQRRSPMRRTCLILRAWIRIVYLMPLGCRIRPIIPREIPIINNLISLHWEKNSFQSNKYIFLVLKLLLLMEGIIEIFYYNSKRERESISF